jgi:transposase
VGKRSVRFLSTIIEVQVQAHVRRIQRQRYHKGCRCPQRPGIVTAPPAPRRIPKSPIGVSVWAEVLLDKYLYGRPTARLCQVLQQHGVPLSQGTVTDGLRQITPLFEPVVQALHERQMGEKLFHGDETRWEVFATLEGKVGHRWYLWVTRSATEYLPNFLYRALKRQMLRLSVYNRTKMPATLKSIYFRLTGLAHYAIHPSTLITRDRSEPQG